LLLNLPPNQQHRAEIAKMMTRISHRHRGVATALLYAAEELAIAHGRTLRCSTPPSTTAHHGSMKGVDLRSPESFRTTP
jgi:ribosomal protein S18 acetylase RimI-like enzyme